MKPVLALAFLFAVGSSVCAQEEFVLPTTMSLAQGGPKVPKARTSEVSSELFFRYTMIGGNDGAGGKWSDDFDNGFGLRDDITYEYHIDPTWSIGGFMSLGFDKFSGVGGLGGLDVFSLLIGPKVKFYGSAHWFAEAYIGGGLVKYSSVDSVIGQVIDRTYTFGLELGTHVGYKFNVDHGRAPTPQFGVILGISFATWDAPDMNQTNLPGASADSMENMTIDFGVWMGF